MSNGDTYNLGNFVISDSKVHNSKFLFKYWKSILIIIYFIEHLFALDIVDNLVKWRNQIFGNNVFFSCMYLDPRFRFELLDNEKERAVYN